MIPQETDREEWLEWRRTHVTASQIATILGYPKQKQTVYEMWQRQLGFLGEIKDNPAMKRGRELEDYVRGKVNEELGTNFVKEVVQHPELEWAGASLDGIDREKGLILEVKCPSLDDHIIAEQAEVPKYYYCQMQWQMFCSGIKKGVYASYFKCRKTGVENIAYANVDFDDQFIADILFKVAEYYHHLSTMTPPAMTEEDYVFIDDFQFNKDAREWLSAQEMRKVYEEKEQYYKDRLTSYTDGSNARGGGIKLTRVKREGAIDVNRLYNDLVEKYGEEEMKQFNPDNYRRDQIGFWKITKEK